ncbi:hypothetical protein AVEN_218165-1 [Araneus ventricosus]|uniref:RNase H type-1 domain-containing protein n=1 Tax=Araneus ventricosus TaxID=182803 RepID=A0A4Y2FRB1_ARAVE|nr:hypothetical protein AVEN_218165-1 [Araneus ventricosus]
MEDKTGSVFCVMEEETKKYKLMAHLRPFNTVFQAELLATQEACLWTSKTNQQFKARSDSELSLHSIDTNSPIAQQTQEILLKSTNIKIRWIRLTLDTAVLKRQTYQKAARGDRQETISRVCYKKIPSSAGKKNGTMKKQAAVFTTFYIKSRQRLLHGNGPK